MISTKFGKRLKFLAGLYALQFRRTQIIELAHVHILGTVCLSCSYQTHLICDYVNKTIRIIERPTLSHFRFHFLRIPTCRQRSELNLFPVLSAFTYYCVRFIVISVKFCFNTRQTYDHRSWSDATSN